MDALERLRPVSDRYASLPVEAAFTWSNVAADIPVGEWYMVVFRSVRRPDTDEDRLDAHDRWAHDEATGSPGFQHYYRGPIGADGACLSFCFWTSRAEARAAAGRPAHALAVAITHETYSTYALEFYRVQRLAGSAALAFELYDTAEPVHAIVGPSGDALDLDERLTRPADGGALGLQLGPATA
jgi:hypothetical protein